MDYTELAKEYLEVINQMRKRHAQKQLTDSMHGEQFVLHYISENEGNVIPSDISNKMGISSARVAAALNNLEKKGMLTRRIDPSDRRKILVDLTDAGRKHAKEHHIMIMKTTIGMLKYLGDTDANEFLRILKKLSNKTHQDFM